MSYTEPASVLMSDDESEYAEFGPYESDLLQSELTDQEATWPEVNDTLLDLLKLQDDWDGQGAAAPTHDLVLECLRFMVQLRNNGSQAPNAVRANPDGSISLEWHFGENLLELELSEHGGCFITSGPNFGSRVETF